MARIQIFKFETIQKLQDNITNSLSLVKTMEHQMSGITTSIKELLVFLDDIQEKDFIEYKHIFQKHAAQLNEFINDINSATQTNNSNMIKQKFQILEKTAKNILNEFRNNRLIKDRRIKNFDSTLSDLYEQVDNIKSSLDDQYLVFENALKKFDKEHRDALSEFNNYKKALTEDNKLHEAKKYWSEKTIRHKIKAFILSIIFIGVLIALPMYANYSGHIPKILETSNNFDKHELNRLAKIVDNQYVNDKNISENTRLKNLDLKERTKEEKQLLSEMINEMNFNRTKKDKQGTYNDTELVNSITNYAFYFLLLSIIIWIARIILKIILSNLHLAEEAHEKETMILTYLALINEGGGLENDDRKLILEAIFRPSTNGLIKDESNVTLLDVANVFKKK